MSKRTREETTTTEATPTTYVFLQLSIWDTNIETWVIARRSLKFQVKVTTTRFSSNKYEIIKLGYDGGTVRCDPYGLHTSSSFRLRVELYGRDDYRFTDRSQEEW